MNAQTVSESRTGNRLELRGSGAVYHRVSTDKQDAERQRKATGEWLERHGVSVKPERVLEDLGWSRADAKRRPAFQRLLSMAEEGEIKWIVVDRQDRFGTATKFELFAYLHRLVEAGCKLYTADDKELMSLEMADSLVTHLNADQSERELREKSLRNLEGKRQRAMRGEWLGGAVPYGMDVVAFRLIDGELIEQWRVQIVRRDLKMKINTDGSKRNFGHNFPASEADELLQLRPSTDNAKLATVCDLFARYASESITPAALSRQLNDQKVEPPPYASRWRDSHVRYLLQNPTYIGLPAWNRHTLGDYFQWTGGRRVEKRPGQKPSKHDEADWILPDKPLFAALIERKLWEKVQARLKSRKSRPRAARSAIYTLSGLVRCGNCGALMVGSKMPSKKLALKDWPPTYLCGTYSGFGGGDRSKCPCKAYRVHQNFLEAELRRFLSDAGQQLEELAGGQKLGPQQLPAFREALQRAHKAHIEMESRVKRSGTAAIAITVGRNGQIKSIDGDTDLERSYRVLFNSERERNQHRLDELETEHTRLTIAWKDLPTQRSKDKAMQQLQELESELEQLESQQQNAADEWHAAFTDFRSMYEAWENARQALEGESSYRRRSEAIKRVIERIVVTFRPTGRSWPVGEVQRVQFVPTQGFSKRKSPMRSA